MHAMDALMRLAALTCLSRVQVLADLLTTGIVVVALIDIEAGAVVCRIELQAHPVPSQLLISEIPRH